ncbi:MAG: PAS domain S-box protein, partial [Ignavibacteria bacterium]
MKNDNFNLQSALQEIKRLKEELREKRQVQNLLHNLSTSILIISQDLTIIYKNLSAEKKHLLSSNDVNNYTSLLYDEKEVNTAKKAIQEVFETEKPLKNIHLLYKNTNKRIGYLLTNFYPVDNELKHVAVEITEDTQTFKTLAEQSKDVIMRFNKEHQHLYVNPAIKDLLPIEPEDMLGKTHRDLGFPEDLVVMWEKAIDKVFKTKETNRIEFELPENNVWIDWLLMPEFDKNNEVQHVITSARNITEIKEYQSRIKNYSKNLEEKIRERTIDKQNMIDKLMDSINETNKLKK